MNIENPIQLYRIRVNGGTDVIRVIRKLDKIEEIHSLVYYRPELLLSIETTLTLHEFRRIIKTIPNSDTMLKTINTDDNFTWE